MLNRLFIPKNILKKFYQDDSDYDHYINNSRNGTIQNINIVDDVNFVPWIADVLQKNAYSEEAVLAQLSNFQLVPTVHSALLNLSNLGAAQHKWVKDSFYRLNVYWSEASIEVHRQVLSYSLADLLSGTGGVLGLWTGISIITLVEFMAFIGTVCKVICQYWSGLLNKKEQVVPINTKHAVDIV